MRLLFSPHLKRMLAYAALLGAWSGSASAALDWCKIAELFPTKSQTFESAAAGLDRLGCEALPQESAHFRAWVCADLGSRDTWLFLERTQSTFAPITALVIDTPRTSLAHLSHCTGFPEPSSWFDSESIAASEQIARQIGYADRASNILFFELGSKAVIAGGTPDNLSLSKYVEATFFGYGRSNSYERGSAEIAGKNLYMTPLREVVLAVERRGARVTLDNAAKLELVHHIELDPPVGLEGVSKVTIVGLKEHIVNVIYDVPKLVHYDALVRALESKYGHSEKSSSTQKGCTTRVWPSGRYSTGPIKIIGHYYRKGSRIWFLNTVPRSQFEAYGEYLKSLEKQSPSLPQIDADNI